MNLDIAFYWKLLVRRMPVMMLFVLLGSGLGVITALKLPETWSTEARLLVEAPQIPDEMVRSTIQTDALEQLDIIQERLLTRANLIDIANRLNVFEDLREMDPDEVEQVMRTATRIRRTEGRNQATVLRISFEARSGRVAAAVVNEYVTIILDENASFRIARAAGTLQFFQQEVQRMEEELARQSAEISQFKSDNVAALPENQSYRLGRQTLLQERLERLERERSVYLAQRDDVLNIYEATGEVRREGGQAALSADEQRLRNAEAELNTELSRYSETHPNIVRLRALMERLEASISADKAALLAEEEEISTEDPVLTATLAEIDTRLNFIKNDIESTISELAQLQEAITRSSSNGIILTGLEREYEIIESRYNAAVLNLNASQMSERIETTAQGQRITIIESATIPNVPTGPNRPKIAISGAAAGIGLAGAYFAVLEFLNRTIRRPAELTSRFKITPIATIPYMESRRRRFVRRASIIGATIFVLISIPSTLWYIDANYLPLDLLVQRSLSRLGLG
ncbi:GumC family protein [Roseobacter litoralis]|uniref:GumC family protein n=1 Tax=Roseobacter litoralis TaxID=42443 RepID=UPI00248F6894|nr:chain length-determining protein [Roseobacter litoralis]